MIKKTVYRVTFDVKVNGKWLANLNACGYASANVSTSGDVLTACAIVHKHQARKSYDGLKPTGVYIIDVSRIVSDIIE